MSNISPRILTGSRTLGEWQVNGCTITLAGEKFHRIADGVEPGDAKFITLACNAHDDMLAALREAQAALNGAPNTIGLHMQIDAAIAKATAP